MNQSVSMFKNPRVVSAATHNGVSVRERNGFLFARRFNATPLTTAEFAAALREFPIVFTKTAEGYVPAALLGIRDEENLFVTDDGKWSAEYVPASLRRHPFVFAHDAKAKTYTLCLDEASDRVNRDGDGNALFTNGKASAYLTRMGEFATAFQREYGVTARFCGKLEELGLLEAHQLRFKLGEGKSAVTSGFFAVDRKKLADLDAETARDLLTDGTLELIHAHLLSLRGVNDLAQKAGIEPDTGPSPLG